MKYFLILISLIVLSCSTKDSDLKTEPQVPSWFIESDTQDGIEISGSGSAPTKDDAINIALNNAISKIKVVISSSVKSEAQVVNGITSEQMQVITNNEIEKFSLSGYDVTNVFFDGKNKLFYAQVKINKLKIYNQKFTEYQAEKYELQNNFHEVEAGNSVSQKLKFFAKNKGKIEALKGEVVVLYSLNQSFPFKSEMEFLLQYSKKAQNIKQSIKFALVDTEAKNLENPTKEVLGSRSFALSKVVNSNHTIKINLSNYITKQDLIYDKFVVKSSITIIFSDGEIPFSNKSITYSGTSSQSYDEAINESIKNFKKQLGIMVDEVLSI